MWGKEPVSVLLFYLGLSKGQRKECADLPLPEGAHRKVDSLQSIFGYKSEAYGSSW